MAHRKHPDADVSLDPRIQIALLVAASGSTDHAEEDGVFRRPPPETGNYFSDEQRRTLDTTLMHLFPDDGDGPSAQDLHAVAYLEWAMTDPVNIRDGDPEFIAKGVRWLDELSRSTHGNRFVDLPQDSQEATVTQFARSKPGKNWLSLLMFYLTEALMLDPYYGGNPDMIGWMWLEHRPGFPRPVAGKGYRDFE